MLSLDVDQLGDWTVVRVNGDIDVAAAPRLRTELIEILSTGSPVRVAVDLHAVDFLDSFGLGVLIGALKRARVAGNEFGLSRIPVALARTLSLVGLDQVFPIVDPFHETPAGTPRQPARSAMGEAAS